MDIFIDREKIVREALFSDETENFCKPCDGEGEGVIKLRLRVLRDNADSVFLYLERSAAPDSGAGAVFKKTEMEKAETDSLFDIYEVKISPEEDVIRYFFEISKGEERVIYDKEGAEEKEKPDERDLFSFNRAFKVPEWLTGAVIYQIFPDRFFNGDPQNDVSDGEYTYLEKDIKKVKDWFEPVENLDVGRFYGGDLRGIKEKLPYLKALGVEAIYLNPIFVSPSNHKYDCQDYRHVDPHLGAIPDRGDGSYAHISTSKRNLCASDRCLENLIKSCHKMGIRIIVDGVFNHCGSFGYMMNREGLYRREAGYPKGAYEEKNSPYHDFFKFENEDDSAWPGNDSYEKWWGMETLPKINYEASENNVNTVLKTAEKWLKPPYRADGWRLDVAADLGHSREYNHYFWKRFRERVKKANPNACIIAEHYGDPSEWLSGDEWDTVMNYDAFMEPVSYFLTGMEKHSDSYSEELCGNGEAFFKNIREAGKDLPVQSLYAAMNELDNHDHSRFLTRTNKRVGRIADAGTEAAAEGINYGLFSAGVIMQFTLPGAPAIYYGDEAGVCGWTDPDSRRTYPWGRENHQIIDFYTYLTGLHRDPVFRKGSFIEILAGKYIIAYARMYENHVAVTVVNAGDSTQELWLPLWKAGIDDSMAVTRMIYANSSRYNVGLHHRGTKNGYLRCVMEPYSAKVYVNWADEQYKISEVER